ncbi:MAG TPA: hypothetical protein VLH79_02265 [Chthonomonadales bacterium]|nr:hypothetical protein [Chthonomonadales bacterium]
MNKCAPALAAFLSLGLAAAALGGAEAATQRPLDTRPDGAPNRAVWMARGSFGVMTHYLVQPKGATPEERTADLNRIVNRFDVEAFVRQIERTGADWLIFTLGQTTGYLCAPNEELDRVAPGHTPSRDLVMEIARRLQRSRKRLILYLPSEQHAEPVLQRAFRYGEPGHTQRYFAFLRSYSVKYGRLLHGWWFDACGPHSDAYWLEWMEALRAGNPDTVVAFSGAEFCTGGPLGPISRLADYHAGEIHLLEDGRIRRDFLPPGGDIVIVEGGRIRKRGQEARTYMPDGQFVGGVQWHGLLPLDLTFNPAVPNQFCRYSDRELFGFVDAVKAVGGAVTINVPIDIETGLIPTCSHAQVVRLGEHLRARRGAR